MNLLHERRFRQAWYQLNEFFSAANGGRESRSAMFDILANVTWNGRDFNGHVEYMTTLYDEVTEAGFPIDEEMKYEYLKKSILRSPNKMFNSILEFADYADNHNYTTLLAKLQIRASADELNNHKDKKIGTNLVNNFTNMNVSENPSNTVNNKSVTVTNPDKNSNSAKLFVLSRNNPNKDHICSLCGKKGHLEDKCFSIMTCEHCGMVGHPKFLCPTVKVPKRRSANTIQKVKFADTFDDKFPKKKTKK